MRICIYRPGISIKEALETLMAEADTRYDRHVIAALFHIIENHSDWTQWQQVNHATDKSGDR